MKYLMIAIFGLLVTTTWSQEEEPFQLVEQEPEFPGGESAMFQFIQKNVQYPMVAREQGIQGRVFVSFIVDKDGSISNVEIVKGVHASLDQEAMRVVKKMPKWSPGKSNGKPVKVKMRLPITFTLT